MYTLNIQKLMKTFPGYMWWDNRGEIVGYNDESDTICVIEDGAFRSDDGTWVVQIYSNLIHDIPIKKMKYGCGECIYEERVNLIYPDNK